MERRVLPGGADNRGRSYEDMRRSRFKHLSPAEIIRFMVELTAPQPSEVICDPAYGTAGFLIAAVEVPRECHPTLNWTISSS